MNPSWGRCVRHVGVLVVAVLLAACSDSDTIAAPPDSTTGSTSRAAGAVQAQLAAVPLSAFQTEEASATEVPQNRADLVVMEYIDLLAATKAQGLVRPEALNDRIPWRQELAKTLRLPDLMATISPENFESTTQEIGIHPLAITSSLTMQRPPTVATLLTGEFGAKDLTAAMGDPKDGMWSVGPVEDFASELRVVSPVRKLGQGLRFTMSGEGVMMSTSTDVARSSIGLPTAGSPSALDDERVRLVAEELDRAEAYAAIAEFGVSRGPAWDPFASPEAVQASNEDPVVLIPFRAMSIGKSANSRATLIFVNESDRAAATNEPILKRVLSEGVSERSNQPLSRYFVVESVTRRGAVIVAEVTLLPGSEGWTFSALGSGDIPFRSGPVSRSLK
jgi:hypothetical protein